MLLALIPILVGGCGSKGICDPKDVAGKYVFRYKTGEIEVVILRTNLSFSHEFYKDSETYSRAPKSDAPAEGTWTYHRFDILLKPWFLYWDYPKPDRLESPGWMNQMAAVWGYDSQRREAWLCLSEDFHYTFVRSDRGAH
jgi:hypothetical protein